MPVRMSDLGRFASVDVYRSAFLSEPMRMTRARSMEKNRASALAIRLAVPFPLAGGGASVCFDAVALETLMDGLGSDYLEQIDIGLAEHRPSTIKVCLDVALRNADLNVDEIVEALPLADVATVIIDALSLRIYGKRASTKSNEDLFIQKAQAVKAAIDHSAADGAEIVRNVDGTATLDSRLVPLVGFLLASLDDLKG